MTPQIAVICPFYRQPKMLMKQFEAWAAYPLETVNTYRFIVVDDASPETADSVRGCTTMPERLEILRIDKDVQWNRSMARNLGTQQCQDADWVLHIDADHVLPPAAAQELARTVRTLDPARWYRFRRYRIGAADETRMKDKLPRDQKFGEIHPHIDSYLCTPKAYWAAGGYNEDFSGVLGGGTPFLKEMERANGAPVVLTECLYVYTRDSVSDSSEHTLPRSPEAFKKRKQEIMKARGTLRGHDPIRLPWHRVF